MHLKRALLADEIVVEFLLPKKPSSKGAVPKLKILSLHVRVFWYNIGINSDITYEF